MTRKVRRAYRYRFYPTPEQAKELARTFGCVRLVYNRMLEERTRAHRVEGRRVSYGESSALLTRWKKTEELAFLTEVSSVPLQQTLRHLQSAFVNFFAKRAGYPTFKSKKKARASAEYTRSGFRFQRGRLTLAKIDDPLDIVWSRPLPKDAEPSTVTVSCDVAGRWFVSILCEESIARLDPSSSRVGVDAGITSVVVLSTGEKITNPRHERRDRRRLRAMLEYKTDWYGRELIVVDRWFPSSKLCSVCRHQVEKMPLNIREWTCARCGAAHDRDVNAARNLLAAGLAES